MKQMTSSQVPSNNQLAIGIVIKIVKKELYNILIEASKDKKIVLVWVYSVYQASRISWK